MTTACRARLLRRQPMLAARRRHRRVSATEFCMRADLKQKRRRLVLSAIVLATVAMSCKREERGFRVDPPAASTVTVAMATDFHAGGALPKDPVNNAYEENAYAMTEGQRLYLGYNCVGCHFHGGGGIGPPLMDDKWIYGSDPDQIFSTIVQGRPNGMPSFRGKIPDYQVWEIVAYVRSMSGLVNKNAAP